MTYDSVNTGCGNIWLIKVDTTGTILWERELNMSGCEELRDFAETDDGGILFTGITTSLIPHPERGDQGFWSNALVGKIDSVGQIEWLQSYGGSNQDQAYQLVRGPYHEFLISGLTHSSNGEVQKNAGLSDAWSLKIDAQGRVKASQTYGGKGDDWALAASLCKNGDFLMAGYTDSPDLGAERVSPFGNGLLIRVSPAGQLRWIRAYPCPQGGFFSEVKELENERIMVAGQCRSSDREQRFWWLLMSPEGHVIRESLLNGPQPGYVTAALPVDNGFLLGGYSTIGKSQSEYAKGGEDFWMIKLDQDGHVIWKDTFGGSADERCVDVIEYRTGVYYALGQKKNQFTRKQTQDMDFWLVKIQELPADSIVGSIWIRTDGNKIYHQKPTRFSARYLHGDRFLWDFGDGTTSTEIHPLKSYDIPGLYDVTLTIFVNEHCRQRITLPKPLEVW